MKPATILALTSTMLLMACGETTSDRTLSGAGIGAGTGAVIGAAVAGDPWTGAAVGGAVGAAAGGAVGAMTTPDEIDLGKPAWR